MRQKLFLALLIIVLIPLTYSIADGIAAGFIAYPILRAFTKNEERTSPVMYVIAALFFVFNLSYNNKEGMRSSYFNRRARTFYLTDVKRGFGKCIII